MKRFFIGLITLTMIAGTTIFTSCNNKKTCNWEISATEQITFNLMEKPITYKVDIRTRETEEMFIEFASQKTNEKVFQYFKNYCTGKGFVFDDKTMAFVIYYDEHIRPSLSVTDEHIKGISAYKVEGDNIMHHLYIRDEQSNFSEIENVNVAVPDVTLNHIFFYLENYVFTDIQADIQNVSSILIWGDFAVETYKHIKKYKTPMRFEASVQFRIKPDNTNRQTEATKGGCGECGGTDGHCVPGRDGGFPYCNPTDYPVCISARINSMGLEQWERVYDAGLMYDFRDNILYKSYKGQQYIEYYYFLGNEWADRLNFDLAIQTADVLSNFNSVMLAFLEPERYMDEVIITPELSNSLLRLLYSYEKITKSSEGRQILNAIQEDIKYFSNRPLKEILAMIEKR